MQESPVKIDPLLEPLLTATSDEHADELLSQLIAGHAGSVIKGIIRFKLRFNSHQETQRAEADDIHQEVVLQLVTQLQRFRKLPSAHPITDVRGMAAIIAHRTCARWMRRQFPERHALKNRLHYLLTRQRGFALWDDNNGKLLAGFTAWQTKPAVRKAFDVENLPAEIRTLKSDKAQELAEVVASLLNYAGGPIEFDELVSAIAALQGISDQPVESLAENEDGGFVTLATLATTPAFAFDNSNGPTLPEQCSSIAAPEGNKLAFHVYAKGVQIYKWNLVTQKWDLLAPQAGLFAEENYFGEVGSHYGGPTWESKSGTKVEGRRVLGTGCTPDPTAVAWILLSKFRTEGAGIFSQVTFIQRVNTVGGLAPLEAGLVDGETREIPYTAEYYFYKAENPKSN